MSDTFRKYFKIGESDSGTVIPPTSGQGESVADLDGRYLNESNNLADLANAATALTNLGLTATAAELNKLDGTNSIVQGNLGLKDGTAVLDLSSLSVTNALSASTLRTDTGKFLSPFSYQFRNAGDTGFRDVQMAALTATGATITGDVSINTGTTSRLTLKGTDIGAPGIMLTDETAGTNWQLIRRGTQSDDLQVLYDDGAVISNFFSISTEGLLHDITTIDIDKGSGLSSDVIRWTKTDQVFSWLLTQRGALDNNMQLLYDDGAVVTTYFEVDRAGNINIPVGTLTGQSIVQESGTIGTDNFASQLTGWRGTYAGDWDVRSLFTDELRAKAFTADITQALAGSDFLTKSVAILDADFTVPWGQKIVAVDTTNKIFEVAGNHTANVAVSNTLFVRESTGNDATYTVSAVTFNGTSGNTEITVNEVISSATADGYIGKQGTLSVEDLPGQDDIAVFTASDWIRLRIFDRSGGGLTIGDAWGLVTGYVDQADGTQDWTFTCLDSGFVAGLDIFKGSIILDYGQSGDGYIERTVLDDQGSPYSQVVTWTGNPIDNQTVKTRTGILDGIANASGAGLYGENSFWTGLFLAGDLTKVSNYMEYAAGVLTVKADAFDLSATNIIIDSALDRAKFGDATKFIDWNAGTLSIASTVFDLDVGPGNLKIDSVNKKISLANPTFGDTGIQMEYNGGTPRFFAGSGVVNDFSLSFDGTNDFIEANQAFDGVGDFTWEIDFKTNSEFSGLGYLMQQVQDAIGNIETQPYLGVRMDSGKIRLMFHDATTDESFSTVGTFNDDTWYHAAIRRNGTAGSILILDMFGNVVEEKAATISSADAVATTNKFFMGRFDSGASNLAFGGNLDNPRIWDTFRTNQQIIDDYRTELAGTELNLLWYSDFDTGSGSTVVDKVGTNDGTISGASWQKSTPFGHFIKFDGITLSLRSGDSLNIADGSITTAKLAAGAVTTSKLEATSVVASKIASSAITADKIATDAVTADKINVSELSAIGATIGGFTIGSTKITGGNVAGEFTGMQSGAGTTKALFVGADDATGANAKFFAQASGEIAYAGIADKIEGLTTVAAFGRNPADAAFFSNNTRNWSAFVSRSSDGTTSKTVRTHRILSRKRFGSTKIIVSGYAKRATSDGVASFSSHVTTITVHPNVIGDPVTITDTDFTRFSIEADIGGAGAGDEMIITIEIDAKIEISGYSSGTFTTETFVGEIFYVEQSA